MSTTLMQVINQRALVAALTEFGERLGSQLGDACPRDTFQMALAECLKELPQQKVKTPKAKVSKGPSKTSLKKASMLDELTLLGGVAPEDDSLKCIRKAISDRKKVIKAEEKSVAIETKKQAKIEAAIERKAAKKASPKGKDYTARRLNNASGDGILGENGSACRVKIHKETREVSKVKEDNWTDEANVRFDALFPEGKDVNKVKISKKINKKIKKKITKKVTKSVDEKLESDQKALIAAMVSDAAAEKLTPKTAVPVVKVAEAPVVKVAEAPVVKVAEAPVVKVAEAPVVKVVEAPVEELKEEELEEEELEEEELEELEEEDDITPEFPGEEEIEEFEHDDLSDPRYCKVDYYVDENANVWDENMTFVGKYNDMDDTLNMVKGYEPSDDE